MQSTGVYHTEGDQIYAPITLETWSYFHAGLQAKLKFELAWVHCNSGRREYASPMAGIRPFDPPDGHEIIRTKREAKRERAVDQARQAMSVDLPSFTDKPHEQLPPSSANLRGCAHFDDDGHDQI